MVQLFLFDVNQSPGHTVLAADANFDLGQSRELIAPDSARAMAKNLIGEESTQDKKHPVKFSLMPQVTIDPRELRQFFHRTDQAITALLRPSESIPSFSPIAEDSDRVQVERGAVFPRFLLDPGRAAQPAPSVERLIVVGSPLTIGRIIVVDRAGHFRPVYRPLLVYSWLQAYRVGYELLPRSEFGRWEEASRTWCDELELRLGEFIWPPADAPAAQGDRIAEICWIALALQVAGKLFIRDAWTDLAADVFGKLVRRQCESGAFLLAGLSDNPETHWFHELAILHAAASYAVQTEDRALASAVMRATRFHLNETQPDHATHQPWGLFAFLWNPDTRSLGEGMLQAAAQSPGLNADSPGISDLTLMLLADALYCLRLFGI